MHRVCGRDSGERRQPAGGWQGYGETAVYFARRWWREREPVCLPDNSPTLSCVPNLLPTASRWPTSTSLITTRQRKHKYIKTQIHKSIKARINAHLCVYVFMCLCIYWFISFFISFFVHSLVYFLIDLLVSLFQYINSYIKALKILKTFGGLKLKS